MTLTPEPDRLYVTPQGVRFFAAFMVVVTGIGCGGVLAGTLRGTICTVLAAIGLITAVRMIFADVGSPGDRPSRR